MAANEVPALEVVIVGAGLCGLALARTLHGEGLPFVLVEARERMGGRVLTRRCEVTGQALDLGPTWFWPDMEPRIAALLAELGLESVPQYDPGDALWLTDPNREPERRDEPGGIHAGARRIVGGAGRLVEALAAAVPREHILTGHALRMVRDCGAWFELQVVHGERVSTLRARRVVLALPPRLVHERVAFDPPLPTPLADLLAATPTWMAAAAKSLTTYDRPFWRSAGHSGSAFVRHLQATLGEVFDASDGATDAGALGGFLALNASQRRNFERGLPLLIESQLAQLYGVEAQGGQAYRFDWAGEAWTCSDADRESLPAWPQADPALRGGWLGGRLYLGGSETAGHGAGHMEGALDAAARIARALVPPGGQRATAGMPVTMQEAVASFLVTVSGCRKSAPAHYRQHVTRLMSSQSTGQLTQHALLATVEQVYSEALAAIDALMPVLNSGDAGPVHLGQHGLTPKLLAAFQGWNRELLDRALEFNAASCALSNFPEEHQPDAELRRVIALDLAAAWREFALTLNERLVDAATHTGFMQESA
ncbi:flavin monoamine oxidase family protein [Paraburkholderia heleia]|uniref:flavin monoamine oxidase family protein n=1 Tax=Paraburkholderia heleia TaxID=634127 RepID=UPI0005A73A78|nr:FAD-dependent oxidoreductase [Paraburkholderia heleia]